MILTTNCCIQYSVYHQWVGSKPTEWVLYLLCFIHCSALTVYLDSIMKIFQLKNKTLIILKTKNWCNLILSCANLPLSYLWNQTKTFFVSWPGKPISFGTALFLSTFYHSMEIIMSYCRWTFGRSTIQSVILLFHLSKRSFIHS